MKHIIYFGLAFTMLAACSGETIKNDGKEKEELAAEPVEVLVISTREITRDVEYTSTVLAWEEVHYAPAAPGGENRNIQLQTNHVGWFHTGDIGMMVDGEFLKITDRKKEIFKLSSGKYVAPQLIENKFKESIFIEQIMVVGENEKFASALISPNFNYLHFWASKYKIHYRDNEELIKKTLVIERIQREVDLVNKELGDHEKIKRFRLVCEEWSPQSGELSPTLKLRRNIIYKKYDHILREIFQYSKNDENGK
jgi:acyl-CoA synthetase (AMP-forming)/AMP-acid ligase II